VGAAVAAAPNVALVEPVVVAAAWPNVNAGGAGALVDAGVGVVKANFAGSLVVDFEPKVNPPPAVVVVVEAVVVDVVLVAADPKVKFAGVGPKENVLVVVTGGI
jgi:hypothetical protein